VSAVKGLDFVSDRVSYIMMGGCWCNIIVLSVHAPSKKSDDPKDSLYEELDQVFYHFPKYHMKILSGGFNAKVESDIVFILTIWNESLLQNSNDNGFRIVNFAISKSQFFKSTMFLHRNIHKYTWVSPDGKTHNQIDHMLIGRKWHSSILDARSFRGADCDS
jgi:hypothetical protein